MNSPVRWLNLAGMALVFIAFSPCAVSADDDAKVRIEYREQVTNFFGGADAIFHLELRAAQPATGRLSWQITAAERKVAGRELMIEVKADEATTIEVAQTLPAVSDGIVFPLELKVTFTADADADATIQWSETLWLFPENPFHDRKHWLESLDIHLFDPKGATSAKLKKLNIPFKPATNLAAVPELKPGLFIVGEGVSWAAQRNLAPLALKLASAGTPVLCLAPSEGSLPLPLAPAADAPVPENVSFRRSEVIRNLDKRLGDRVWVAGQPLVLRELSVVSERQSLQGQFADPGNGWPWLEVDYPGAKSKFIWCGWGVIRDWDQSPAPRFLFARLMEVLSNAPLPADPQTSR